VTELRKIETEPSLVFDVLVAGPADGPLVLLLHGFAESFHMWRSQLPALAAAGYRAVAPSQRGYSAGARPDTADVANYHFDRLVADAMNVVATSGPAVHLRALILRPQRAMCSRSTAHKQKFICSAIREVVRYRCAKALPSSAGDVNPPLSLHKPAP
jgi:hypothetical protein